MSPTVLEPASEDPALIAVRFQLSVGSGGTVVVDSREHALPFRTSLALGLHAITFRHDGQEANQMIYVGAAAATEFVFDSSTHEVHAFK